MGVGTIHRQLRRASEEIESARRATTAAEAEEYLAGVARMLDHYVEGDTSDPEAHAYPQPGALDTIQARLEDVLEDVDDPAAEHLRDARSHLLEVILSLDERLNEGRPSSRGR